MSRIQRLIISLAFNLLVIALIIGISLNFNIPFNIWHFLLVLCLLLGVKYLFKTITKP